MLQEIFFIEVSQQEREPTETKSKMPTGTRTLGGKVVIGKRATKVDAKPKVGEATREVTKQKDWRGDLEMLRTRMSGISFLFGPHVCSLSSY